MGGLIPTSPFAFNPHAVPPLVTAAAILGLGLFVVVRERASRVSFHYLAYTAAAGCWMACAGIALLLSSEAATYRWMTIANVGVSLIPATLYHFTVVVLEKARERRLQVSIVWALSLLFLAASLLTDNLFEGFYHYAWGIYVRFRWPAYLFMVYFFVMMVATLRLYWTEYRRSDRDTTRHRRAKALLTAFSIGYLGALDFLPAIGVPYYPLSSVPMTGMLILVSRTIWRYRLVDITPAFAAQEIIDNMGDALIVLDRDGVICLVNRTTCVLFGAGEADLVGQRPAACFAFCPDLAEALGRTGHRGPDGSTEVTCCQHDGDRRTFGLTFSAIQGAAGAPDATLCLISDISYRKSVEEERERLITQLTKANEQLQSIDRMKTNFISMASHELRTPLTTIKAFIELLLIKRHMPEERKYELMSTVNEEADRLARLISNLLDLARIESGSLKWEREELALEPLVQRVIAGMSLLFQKKGVRVTTAFHGGETIVSGDRDRLVQVVTNILSNAVKYTREGGAVLVTVRREEAPHSRVAVEVADTGIGIREQDLPRIFEKFHRVEEANTSDIEGTGLGLAISREIVEHHGGSIWATSVYGKGSVFTFTLPLAEREPAQLLQ